MARSTPGDTEIEWLDADGTPPSPQTSESLRRPGRWLLPAGALALLLAVALVSALFGSGEAPASDDEDPASSAERRRAELFGQVSGGESADEADPEVNALQGEIVTELRELASLDLSFRAVLTSIEGGEARLVSVGSSGDVRVAPLPTSDSFRFDVSGQWLAGVSETSQGNVLWAGRVGSPAEPLAAGVRGYAWHDSTPGVLAWSDTDGRALTTLALDTQARTPVRVDAEAEGGVEGWGDWGFALMRTGLEHTVAVLDADGALVDASLSGRLGGHLPSGELLVSGGLDGAVAFDPSTGLARELTWLTAGRHIRSTAISDDPSAAIMMIDPGRSRPAAQQGEIMLVADGLVAVLARTPAPTDVAWSAEDEVVVFAEQATEAAGGDGRIRVVDGSGMVGAVRIPDLFRGREWVAALSVR